jgi:hypothetical protein
MDTSLTAGWDNFYVITGSAAGGLIGLTFVVIALMVDVQGVSTTGLRAFVTPTIVHFGVVLALAAYLSAPHQHVLTLATGVGITGLFGLGYSGVVAWNMAHRSSKYVPGWEDWTWNVVAPFVVYGALIALAVAVWTRPAESLYGIAVGMLLLLFIGIHNAWDIAVWMTIENKRDQK